MGRVSRRPGDEFRNEQTLNQPSRQDEPILVPRLDKNDGALRQAFSRLDLLIGRYASELAIELHWPIMQLDDAVKFLERGFESSDLVGRGNVLGDEAATSAELEGRFYRREIPAALKEARDAIVTLQTLRAGFGVLARENSMQPGIWSPVDLVSRAIDISRPVWKKAFVIDTLHPDVATARLTCPARYVFCALVEILYQLAACAPKRREPAPMILGLYKDGGAVNLLIELPDVTGYPAGWQSRLDTAKALLSEANGALEFRRSGTDEAIAISLRN